MNQPVIDELIARIRVAAASETPSSALRELLHASVEYADAMADAIAVMDEDEVLLFEDETCSIWSCRYNSDVVFAPHEHCMTAHIAVYRGAEVEVLYHRDPDRLRHTKNLVVAAGEVISLGSDVVHAVTADGNGQSHAIHIYEGPLTKVTRSLFEWTTGEEIAFTMENFHTMLRNKSDMDEFVK